MSASSLDIRAHKATIKYVGMHVGSPVHLYCFMLALNTPTTPACKINMHKYVYTTNLQTLTRVFTHAAHQGVVKAISAAGPYLASGGADDLIHIFDLKNDKDLGFLVNPGEGPITALHFVTAPGAYTPSHLLAGAADGTISVWRVGGGWECMKSIKGHRKEVTAIGPHPSGKLALTTSRDGSLRMWDLIKGRAAFTTKLESEVDAVAFDAAGERYAMLSGALVTLHGVEGGLVASMQHPRKVLCMCWGTESSVGGESSIITGCEDGSLRVWNATEGTEVVCVPRAHPTRIKAVAVVGDCIATAASDGIIRLWNLQKAVKGKTKGDEVESIAEVATRARLTVMCSVDPPETIAEKLKEQKNTTQIAKKKRKHAANDEEKNAVKPSAKNKQTKQQQHQGDKKAAPTKRKQQPQEEEVVSFIDDRDREKIKKKQKQVQIQATRKEEQRKAKGKGKVKVGQ